MGGILRFEINQLLEGLYFIRFTILSFRLYKYHIL